MNTIAGFIINWLAKGIGFNSAKKESVFLFTASFICYFINTSLLATHNPENIKFGMTRWYTYYGPIMVSAVFWTMMTAQAMMVFALWGLKV